LFGIISGFTRFGGLLPQAADRHFLGLFLVLQNEGGGERGVLRGVKMVFGVIVGFVEFGKLLAQAAE